LCDGEYAEAGHAVWDEAEQGGDQWHPLVRWQVLARINQCGVRAPHRIF
jgi:hypothetical protein